MRRSSLARFAESRLWLILSLAFGAVIPLTVWTIVFIVIGVHVERSFGGMVVLSSYFIVIAEVAALVIWHLRRHASAVFHQAASAVFLFGAMFAACWSCYGLWGVAMIWGELPGGSVSLTLLAVSPFPCVIVYFVNACAARSMARELGSDRSWSALVARTPRP